MEVSLGWQPCTCCSLLICARFYKAGLWLRLAWCRNCNYCCLAEMPSITNKLWCIQIKRAVFSSGFWDMDITGSTFFFHIYHCTVSMARLTTELLFLLLKALHMYPDPFECSSSTQQTTHDRLNIFSLKLQKPTSPPVLEIYPTPGLLCAN